MEMQDEVMAGSFDIAGDAAFGAGNRQSQGQTIQKGQVEIEGN